jgi:prevent-host-death family protein
MVMKRIPASSFKARCLALLDEVAATGEELEVTKRGRAVARVTAVERPPSLEGSVDFLVDDHELIEPIAVDWDAAAR